MADFARRFLSLQKLFPPSGTAIIGPNSLSETVSPVYPIPQPPQAGDRSKFVSIASTTGVAPSRVFAFDKASILNDPEPNISTAQVTSVDFYAEIFVGDISHDSVTARIVQIFLRSPTGQNVAVARWGGFASIAVAGQPSGFEPIFGSPSYVGVTSDRMPTVRPLIVLPGWQIFIVGDTAAAAYTITLDMGYIIHPLSEPVLFIG